MTPGDLIPSLGSADDEDDGFADLRAALTQYTGDQKVEEAVASRSKENSLRQQALEEATLTGLLVDLAEKQAAVTCRTGAGRVHQGIVAAVGNDFVAIRQDSRDSFVHLEALVDVEVASTSGTEAAMGNRPAPVETRMADVIFGAAETQPRVRIGTFIAEAAGVLTGELHSVGEDVVTLRLENQDRSFCYVALGTIIEFSPLE